MRITILTLAMAMMIVGSVGCSRHGRPAWFTPNPVKWADRNVREDPIEIPVAGALAIDVESFNGDVEIKGTDKGDTAVVRIVREGVHGFGRSKESKNSLDDIVFTTQIVPGELGQALQVRTSTSNAEPHFQRAHVLIEAPRIEDVSVHTHNGRVQCKNIAGSVDISTDEGDVRILTNQAMIKPVTIVNRNGTIDYRIRGESTGRFDCETVEGRVYYRVKYGRPRIMVPTDRDTLNATLNDGTNMIRMRTVNGDIRVAVVKNPEQIGEFITNGLFW